jgi:hypothetical protein
MSVGMDLSGFARTREYTSTILSSASDIVRLDDDVNRLMPDRDVSLSPRFALASRDADWSPRVAVVSRRGVVAGIVFGKERWVAGLPSGLIYVDGRLGRLIVSNGDDCEAIVSTAIRSYFAMPRIRGVRLAIASSSPEAAVIERTAATLKLDVARATPAPYELHSTLPLPPSYETFLASLGAQTRHNFRYYRRRFEAAGHRYVERVAPRDVEEILLQLRTKSRIPFSTRAMKTATRRVMSTNQPWAAGLRHANGEYLSVAAGWFERGRAILLLQQNNDLEFSHASLSVVLRGYLIETLIAGRVPELLFWSGSATPLSRYARPLPAITLYFDAKTLGWRLTRAVAAAMQAFVGPRVSSELRWVALPGAN